MKDFIFIVIFAVATIIGYFMVKAVPSLRHAPLLSGLNALSGVALFFAAIRTTIEAVPTGSKVLGVCAVFLAAVGVMGNGGILYRILKNKIPAVPERVALYNGFGGAAAAIVALITMIGGSGLGAFVRVTAMLALIVGMLALTGNLAAAGKLRNVITQQPVVLKGHKAIFGLLLLFMLAATAFAAFPLPRLWFAALYLGCYAAAAVFGLVFAIRVDGADMPITISLLNAFSGAAGAIIGMALGNPFLVAVGGLVSGSGLLLTQSVCRTMNRSLTDILFVKIAVEAISALRIVEAEPPETTIEAEIVVEPEITEEADVVIEPEIIEEAEIIIEAEVAEEAEVIAEAETAEEGQEEAPQATVENTEAEDTETEETQAEGTQTESAEAEPAEEKDAAETAADEGIGPNRAK